jgi:hypothetical protein
MNSTSILLIKKVDFSISVFRVKLLVQFLILEEGSLKRLKTADLSY